MATPGAQSEPQFAAFSGYAGAPGQHGAPLYDPAAPADGYETHAMPPPPSLGGLGSPSETPAPGVSAAAGQETHMTHGLPPPPPPGVPSGNIQSIPSSAASYRSASGEPNKKALYVGGLDGRITEDILRQIFETAGAVTSVKIILDKTGAATQGRGFNYGFVEYEEQTSAERAMQTLNGRRVHNNEIRVNWAYQSNNSQREDTSQHFHVFVGDLSNEVNDDILQQAFSAFGTISEARVMWDAKTGRSRGYGFVAYRERAEAEKALNSMDGEWLGSRAIRCNWANQRGGPSMGQQQTMSSMGMTPYAGAPPAYQNPAPAVGYRSQGYPSQGGQSYELIVNQTPHWQATCYVGNLTPYTTQNDLAPLFQAYGYIVESRLQTDRGFAFIKMDSHENAAMAICQLNGVPVNGRPLKCGWGKDRPPTGQFDGYGAQGGGAYNTGPPQNMSFPQYGGGGPAPQSMQYPSPSYSRPAQQYGPPPPTSGYPPAPSPAAQGPNSYSNVQRPQYPQYGQAATQQPSAASNAPSGVGAIAANVDAADFQYSSSTPGANGYAATSSYGY